MSSQKVDVLVIGGGIVGVCLAHELQSQGRSVVLLEKGQIGEGCSYANAGWITPCFAMPLPQPGMFWKSVGWLLDNQSPLHIKPQLNPLLLRWMFHFLKAMNKTQMQRSIAALTDISKYSLDYYQTFASRADNSVAFEKRGLLMVSATADGLKYAEHERDVMADRGIEGKTLSRDELLNFEPALKPLIKGGIYFPNEAQLEPYPTTLALAEDFKKLGGKIITRAEAFEFEIQNEKIRQVHTTQGLFEAELVVLAAGSWSTQIARQLRTRIPILGGKGYSMNFIASDKKPLRPIMIVEKKIAVTPRSHTVRIAGTLELVNQDLSISPHRLKAIQNGAKEYLHFDTESEPTEIWRGLRPCTPDGVPVIGYSKKISNLFYCSGHQLLGLQSAPGSARLASDLILNKQPLTDPHAFRAERFE